MKNIIDYNTVDETIRDFQQLVKAITYYNDFLHEFIK